MNGLGLFSTNVLKPDIPTSFEPVNAIPSTSGLSSRVFPTTLPAPVTKFITAGGNL